VHYHSTTIPFPIKFRTRHIIQIITTPRATFIPIPIKDSIITTTLPILIITYSAAIIFAGKEKWRFASRGAVSSSPAVSSGVVYFGSEDHNVYAIGGAPSSQVNPQTTTSAQTVATYQAAEITQTTISPETIAHPQTVATNRPAEANGASTPIWDRNILIYLVLLVFVLIFGALLYDTYYKKKR
jgi:hypothetical protein